MMMMMIIWYSVYNCVTNYLIPMAHNNKLRMISIKFIY